MSRSHLFDCDSVPVFRVGLLISRAIATIEGLSEAWIICADLGSDHRAITLTRTCGGRTPAAKSTPDVRTKFGSEARQAEVIEKYMGTRSSCEAGWVQVSEARKVEGGQFRILGFSGEAKLTRSVVDLPSKGGRVLCYRLAGEQNGNSGLHRKR
jgi:hypothetical protein